jgi:apolipoprotein N-acyltransferase
MTNTLADAGHVNLMTLHEALWGTIAVFVFVAALVVMVAESGTQKGRLSKPLAAVAITIVFGFTLGGIGTFGVYTAWADGPDHYASVGTQIGLAVDVVLALVVALVWRTYNLREIYRVTRRSNAPVS